MNRPDVLAVIVFYGAIAVVGLVFFREVTEKLREFAVEAKRMYVETPLRLVTGRRRPDHAGIARMERELPPNPERSET